jgi:hypothetical protein
MHGDSEARSMAYLKYALRVLELATKQFAKNSIGLKTGFLSRTERCIAL